jgi:hypothetical protein
MLRLAELKVLYSIEMDVILMLDALKPQDKLRLRYQDEGSELDHQGIFTYCIDLDAAADAYVADIFGKRYTVIDNITRLPEQLPKLLMALTR